MYIYWIIICYSSSSKFLFIEPLLGTTLLKNSCVLWTRKNTCNVTTRIKIYGINCCMFKTQFKWKRIVIVVLIQPILHDKSVTGGGLKRRQCSILDSCDHEFAIKRRPPIISFSSFPFIRLFHPFLQIAFFLLTSSHTRTDD